MKRQILKIFILSAIFFIAFGQVFASEDLLGAQMHNALGVEALGNEQIDAAISHFERAYRLAPKNKTIKKNLSVAYYRKGEMEYSARRFNSAEKYLSASLEKDPDNINALVLMGDIKYLSQNLDEAKKLWERALKINSDYPYADALKEKLKKLEKEAKIEKKYRQVGMDQFDIVYSKEGTKLSYNVRYYLQEAYRLIGQAFNHHPKHKITVLIYERQDFESIGDWRKGTVGAYDGKIRLPLIGAKFSSDEIKSLVRHEYTHVIIHDIAKGKCPIWLDEGLAKYEEFVYADKDLSVLKNAVGGNRLIPFKDLDSVFSNPEDGFQLELAYEESYTLVNYLIKRYSRYKIKKILERLGEGEQLESAFRNELNLTMAEFEKRWLRDLKAGKLY